MWPALKQLNNPTNSKAVLEIIKEDGSISRNTNDVLSKWYRDISELYSGLKTNHEIAFDDEFYNEVKRKKIEFEEVSDCILPHSFDSQELNREFSNDEVFWQ